jgi:hypothetical protein
MAAVDDVEELIERYDLALGEFYNGNPKPVQSLWSHRDDVTLAPPFGAPTHGWEEVAASMERGASQFTDGENTGFEVLEKYVTPEYSLLRGEGLPQLVLLLLGQVGRDDLEVILL